MKANTHKNGDSNCICIHWLDINRAGGHNIGDEIAIDVFVLAGNRINHAMLVKTAGRNVALA